MDWSQRYSTSLAETFSRQRKLEFEWQVELALLRALGEVGLAPAEAYDSIKAIIDSKGFAKHSLVSSTAEIVSRWRCHARANPRNRARNSPRYNGDGESDRRAV